MKREAEFYMCSYILNVKIEKRADRKDQTEQGAVDRLREWQIVYINDYKSEIKGMIRIWELIYMHDQEKNRIEDIIKGVQHYLDDEERDKEIDAWCQKQVS